MIAKSNVYLEEGQRVLFGSGQGVVQVIYKGIAYVMFRDGSIKTFDQYGKYLGDYVKRSR